MNSPKTEVQQSSIVVRIDADLEELIPAYLDNRRHDVRLLTEALQEGNYERIRITGHSMKGSGGGYGFDQISEIGAALEAAAQQQDVTGIEALVHRLLHFVEHVEIVFE